MGSIDERVVAMSFENAKFEAGVAQTMATLSKLNASLAKIGGESGLGKIEAEANKVTLQGPMSALDKLRARLGFVGDTKGFTDVQAASEKVTLEAPMSALDKLRSRLSFIGDTKGFTDVEAASNNVTLSGINGALDSVTAKFGAMQVAGVAALGTLVSKATTAGIGLAKSISIGPLTGGLEEYATNLNSIQTILANTQASGAGLSDVNAALQQLNTYSDQTIYNFSQMAKNIGTFTAAGVDLKTATGSIKGIANLAALSGSNSQQASTAMYQLSQAISAGRVSLQDWNSVVNAGMGGTVFQRALATTAQSMGTLEKGSVKLTGKMKNATINGQSFRESITARPGEKSWLTSEVLTNTLRQFTGDLSDADLKAQGFNDAQIKSIQQTAKTAKNAATEVKTLKGVWDVAKESMGSGWAATWQLIFGDFGEAKKLFTGVSNALQTFIGNSAKARNAVLKDWKHLGGRTLLIDSIKTAFKALGEIVGAVKKAFRDIFPAKTGRDLFEITKALHRFAESLKANPETLENLRRTFRGFFAVLSIGWYIIKQVADVIFDLLGIAGEGAGGFLNFTGSIGDFLTALQQAIVKGDALGGVFETITKVLRVPLQILKAIADAFFDLFDGADSDKAEGAAKSLDGVNSSLRPMRRILDNVTEAWHNFLGFLERVKEQIGPTLDKLAEPFRKFADTVSEAIGGGDFDKVFSVLQTALLGGILVALRKGLGKGINVTVGKLDGLNKVMGGLTSQLTAMQRNVQANTLLQIAAAIALLAAGVAILSSIDPKKLTSAMTGVAVGLGELIGALAILGKVSKGASFFTMPLIAASMVELALALNILAIAMKIFATMSWEELAKGLAAVGGALGAIAIGTKFLGPSLIVTAPGILAVALAMNVLAIAMKIFSTFSWEEIAKGIAAITGALLALGIGLSIIGPSVLLVGPGLIAVAFAITLLSGAVLAFGSMDLETLAKGVGAIAAALVAIGLAIQTIPPTVALQAAGLVILAIALTGIAGAIRLMGGMDIATIVKGLATLGGALLILAVGLTAMVGTLPGSVALLAAATALALLAPTLAFLGTLDWGTIFKGLAAMALVLGTLALVGVVASSGLLALGVALTVLSVAVLATGAGMLLMAKAFSLLSSEGTKGVAIFIAALTAFIAVLPKLVIDFIKGLVEIIGNIAELAPKVVASMVKIIGALLQVIIESAPKIAVAVGALILAFVTVLNENAPRLIAAGFKLLLAFLSGMANHIGRVTTVVARIITRFLEALAENLPRLITAGVSVILAFIEGIGDNLWRIAKAGVRLARKFLNAVVTGLVGLAEAGADAVINFLHALAAVIREKAPELWDAGFDIADAIVDGFGDGIKRLASKLKHALTDWAGGDPAENMREVMRKLDEQIKRQGGRPHFVADFDRKRREEAGRPSPNRKKVALFGDVAEPVITPVVDLSNVEEGAQQTLALMSTTPVLTDTLAEQAAAISEETATSEAAQAEAEPAQAPVLQFEQNNYSPEALSELEIYRQTKNQLAFAKKRLKLT